MHWPDVLRKMLYHKILYQLNLCECVLCHDKNKYFLQRVTVQRAWKPLITQWQDLKFLAEYIVPCDKYLLNIYSIPDIGFSYENTRLDTGLLPSDNPLPNNTRTATVIMQWMLQTMYAEVCWEHGRWNLYFFMVQRADRRRRQGFTEWHLISSLQSEWLGRTERRAL